MIGAVLGFAKAYRMWIVVAAVAGVLGSGFLYVRGAENAKQRVGVLEERLGIAETDLKANQTAFDVCWEANVKNAKSAAEQREKAMAAELRLAEMSVNADRDVEDVERESEAFANRGLGCPAFDDDFIDWLLDTPGS